jgi:GNAT superfamily N-acetyltransferase
MNRSTSFRDSKGNLQYNHILDHRGYAMYSITLMPNATQAQISNLNQVLERFVQRSFETPDRLYPDLSYFCGSRIFAMFHRNGSIHIENITGLLLGRVEASDNSHYICYLSVLPNHRQRGLATQLMQHAIRDAIRSRRNRVTLHVNSANGNALGLYRECGFRCADFIANYYLNDQTYSTQDAFAMMLHLSNVKNASAVCVTSAAVEITQREEATYRERCPQSYSQSIPNVFFT